MTVHTQYPDTRKPNSGINIKPAKHALGLILAGCVVMFLILQGGLIWLNGQVDATLAAIGVTAVMLVTAVIFERWLFKLDI